MIKIGHSSIDENGHASGGQAGDQNGREIYIRDWYNKPWGLVLRPKDSNIAEKMAIACEKGCANDNIGYDQNQRNTLKTQAVACGMDLSKITTPCECDCSSFMTVCAECAGVPIPYNGSNAPTTSTMKDAFMSTGQFDLLTDQKYLTSDNYLKRGDVLVAPGSHTVMALQNGSNATKAVTNKAVDISKYNTITDYKAMVNQIKNIIIRCGYRSSSTGTLTEDDLFKKHIENSIANGANIGIYFYDQSINETEAIEQANWVVNLIKPYASHINMPIYIDSESMRNHDGRADNISKEQRTKNVVAFCNRIQQLNYQAGVYSGNSWYKNNLIFDQIKQFNIWCARYSTTPPDIPRYDIWQYGSEIYSWATGVIDTNNIYNLKVNAKPSAPVENKPSTPNKPTPKPQSSGLTAEKPILLMGKVNVKEGALNVRTLPTTDAPVVTQIPKDTYIQLRGDLGTWYRMDMGYVSKQYIKEAHGVVTANKLNVRSAPDKTNNNNIITTIPINTEVIICTAGNGWYCILLDNGQTGWVSGMYIRLK